MRRAACLAALAVSVCSFVLGCGDDDGGGSALTITKLIGPEGGTVELSGGGKVTIPAGALTETTSIKITKLELNDVAPVPNNLEAAGKPYAFEPHGQNFAQTVKIEVPFEDDGTEVRPVKLDDEDDTSWTTVVGSTKDEPQKKLSMDTTSFSVILAARPRRDSGVITLPDGAIVEDASNAGTGGTGGSDTDAGGGTGGSGGTAGSDAGMDAAVATGPCDATAVAVSAITLPTPGSILTNGPRTFITTTPTILTAYTGSGTSLTSAGDLITLNAGESFNGVSTGGSIVAAVTNGGSASGRVLIAPVDGTGTPTVYDLINYSAYGAIYDQRPEFAYSPTARHVATDGNVIAVAMTTGALILFSPAGQPLGFIHNTDLVMSPMAGTVAMVITGNYLVVGINRMVVGTPTFNAIRVFDITTPGNITMVDEVVRTDQPYSLIADPTRNRFLMSNLAGGQVIGFSVDSGGNIGADTLVATGIAGGQARAIAVTGDLLLLGNPSFATQPVDFGVSVFGLVGNGSVSRGVIDLPDGDYSVTASAGGNFYYSGSSSLNVIDLTSCLPATDQI